MYFKILEDNDAKDFFDKYKDDLFVEEWIEEKNVKSYLLYNDDSLKSFALLTKMDTDPLKTHSNPFYLSYIYTIEEHRRNGHALSLLLYIKNFENTTVFCTDDIASSLFIKAGYVFSSYESLYKSFPIYRGNRVQI